MRRILGASVCVLVLLSLSSALAARPIKETIAETPRKGPRTEDLVIKYYGNVTAAYTALKADEIDLLAYEIPADLYRDAIVDPNVVLIGVADLGTYELDLNNNYTIHTYSGVENPLWFKEVRRAVAWCTDKKYIVEVICGGFAERIDAPIGGAPAKGWANESYWYPNYPYEYDPARAAAELDEAGWIQGSTPNPHYEPVIPGSAQFLRTYPPGHSKAGLNVDPLMWYIRTDDQRRNLAGHLIADAMEKIGFKTNRMTGDSPTLRPKVMIEKDYHLYTGAWSGSWIPLQLYTLYHSSQWTESGASPNYVTGNNQSNLPNYPRYDELAEQVFSPATWEDGLQASKLATGYWVDQCINIPLFGAKSYWAYSSKVMGLVNYEGDGFENGYSFMNAYKADGSPIRIGTKSPPPSMNPQYATWYYSYQNLERCFGYADFGLPPYNIAIAQASWLQDWELGKWNDSGADKLTRTDWVRSDLYFCEPVTGNKLSNVNASDYLFSVWYTHADKNAWPYNYVSDVHHIEINDAYSWTVHFHTDNSWWANVEAHPMLYPVDVWLREPLANRTVDTFPAWSGTGAVPLTALGDPVWINEVTVDGAPLALGVDYNLFGYGRGIPATLNITTPQSGTLTVDYWAYGSPQGFTPGNLPWDTILVGSGMYYLTSFTAGVGGGATFKRNPYYWMETPPIGEVDFVWKWEDGPKPRSGYYKIDIYDVVMAIGEYGSDGTGIPDSALEDRRWFPGADFAPQGGRIDIYDVVSMTGQYGQTFAAP